MDAAGTISAAHREVGFVQSIQLFFKNYADFQGRSSRGAYWWLFLANILASVITNVVDAGLAASIGLPVVGLIFSLVTLIPGVALGVRRLHDVGRSGWWLLIAFTVIGILLLIYWYVQPGQRQENRFGPDVEAGARFRAEDAF